MSFVYNLMVRSIHYITVFEASEVLGLVVNMIEKNLELSKLYIHIHCYYMKRDQNL